MINELQNYIFLLFSARELKNTAIQHYSELTC